MIYIDVDGVVADFENSVYDLDDSFTIDDWKNEEKLYSLMKTNYKSIYRYSKKTRYFDYFMNMYKDNPGSKFLTAAGTFWSPEELATVVENKYRWLYDHGVSSDDVIIVGDSREKISYCKPGDILYDDKTSTIEKWNQAGGMGFQVYNPAVFKVGFY